MSARSRTAPTPDAAGVTARRVALDALVRIETDDAYANLVLRHILDRADLDDSRDRALVTDLVYGTTRMRRACDALVAPYLQREIDPPVRAALRLGTYQIHMAGIPPHAAVSSTVGAVPPKVRGFVNAILRRVASTQPSWPDDATRLSYPDWIVERLRHDLGREQADGAMEQMNLAPHVHHRADGYTQDLASQWVADLVGASEGDRVADLCAAPGGKATAIAANGAWVAATDLRRSRVGLVVSNVETTGGRDVAVAVGDALAPPFAPASFDRVLVDAPCSGLGVLRRRADARWRIAADDVTRLAELQRRIVDRAADLRRLGGVLVYSVCTLTAEETFGVDEHLASTRPDLAPLDPPGDPWIPWGRGALLLPQAADTDGMMVLRLRRRTSA
jgi:16S rRNA (cytosine967-C5)-methyltransferase